MAKIKVGNPPYKKGYSFRCAGCKETHRVNDAWQFNGDLDKPTFSPSIKVTGTIPITDEECERILNGEKITPTHFVCHSFVKNGQIQYLNDCTHELAGKTVEIPDWDDE